MNKSNGKATTVIHDALIFNTVLQLHNITHTIDEMNSRANMTDAVYNKLESVKQAAIDYITLLMKDLPITDGYRCVYIQREPNKYASDERGFATIRLMWHGAGLITYATSYRLETNELRSDCINNTTAWLQCAPFDYEKDTTSIKQHITKEHELKTQIAKLEAFLITMYKCTKGMPHCETDCNQCENKFECLMAITCHSNGWGYKWDDTVQAKRASIITQYMLDRLRETYNASNNATLLSKADALEKHHYNGRAANISAIKALAKKAKTAIQSIRVRYTDFENLKKRVVDTLYEYGSYDPTRILSRLERDLQGQFPELIAFKYTIYDDYKYVPENNPITPWSHMLKQVKTLVNAYNGLIINLTCNRCFASCHNKASWTPTRGNSKVRTVVIPRKQPVNDFVKHIVETDDELIATDERRAHVIDEYPIYTPITKAFIEMQQKDTSLWLFGDLTQNCICDAFDQHAHNSKHKSELKASQNERCRKFFTEIREINNCYTNSDVIKEHIAQLVDEYIKAYFVTPDTDGFDQTCKNLLAFVKQIEDATCSIKNVLLSSDDPDFIKWLCKHRNITKKECNERLLQIEEECATEKDGDNQQSLTEIINSLPHTINKQHA